LKNFTDAEKNIRLKFAQKSLNLDLRKLIFMDESSFQTKRSGLSVNRKPSSLPKHSGIKERFCQTVHVWCAISEKGVVCFKVVLIFFFLTFEF
jgi:hypothetical protein